MSETTLDTNTRNKGNKRHNPSLSLYGTDIAIPMTLAPLFSNEPGAIMAGVVGGVYTVARIAKLVYDVYR